MPEPASAPGEDRVVAILDHLHKIYLPEGVGTWLFGRHRRLWKIGGGHYAPIELLREGRYDEVEAVLPPLDMVAT